MIKGTHAWNFSPKWTLEVIEKMKLPPAQQNRLRVLMGEKPIVRKDAISSEVSQKLLGVWYYSLILSSFELKDNQYRPEALARRFGIRVAEVEETFAFLRDNNLIVPREDGGWKCASEIWETTDDVPNEMIQKFHRDQLHLAEKALSKIDVRHREFQTLTLVGNKEMLEEIKVEIRSCIERIAVLMKKQKENNEIYRLSMQLFPVSLEEKKSDD